MQLKHYNVHIKKSKTYNELKIKKAPPPARLSGVHETSRPGATTTRTFEMNQAKEQVMAQAAGKPQRRRNTEISESTTVQPQASGRGSA